MYSSDTYYKKGNMVQDDLYPTQWTLRFSFHMLQPYISI